MNLIENYIQPDYQIRKLSRQEVPFEYDGKGFVSFDGLVDCYGNIRKVHKIFSIEQWEKVKKTRLLPCIMESHESHDL